VQPCACEANGAQRLAAHLCQAREHVLDAGTRLGDNFEDVLDAANTNRDILADKGYVDGEREA